MVDVSGRHGGVVSVYHGRELVAGCFGWVGLVGIACAVVGDGKVVVDIRALMVRGKAVLKLCRIS